MDREVVAARDLVSQIDRTLTIRRLYSPGASPYRDAMEQLWVKLEAAVQEGDVTLVLAPSEISCEGEVVYRKEKREDGFHFPLYRDGLREFRLDEHIPRTELERFLEVFESERHGLLEPTEDTVGFLWRCDLQHVTYSAIDGIGDVEAGEDGLQGLVGSEFQSLVADLLDRIRKPAEPVTGQSYAFVLDADIAVSQSDFLYDAGTTRIEFDAQPTVFRLTAEEAERLRSESGEESEAEKLDRFVEILFAILMDSDSTVPGRKISPVLTRILDGYWRTEDLDAIEGLLDRLETTIESAPTSEKRDSARSLVEDFLGAERLRESLQRLEEGKLSERAATALWRRSGAKGWKWLFAVWSREGFESLASALEDHLRRQLVDEPDLLRTVFSEGDASQVVAGLELLGDRAVLLYTQDVLDLAEHTDPGVRFRAVARMDQVGGGDAEKILWRLFERDTEAAIRLLALRRLLEALGTSAMPRLLTLISRDAFRQRPMWERERIVRMLGERGGPVAEELFHSWIPDKWLWQGKDFESAELGLRGLLAAGRRGVERVRDLTASRSPAAKIARKLLTENEVGEEDTAGLEALLVSGGPP